MSLGSKISVFIWLIVFFVDVFFSINSEWYFLLGMLTLVLNGIKPSKALAEIVKAFHKKPPPT